MLSLTLLTVVLSSENFTSVKENSEIWKFLTLHEEQNVEKLATLVCKREAQVQKELDASLKDLKLHHSSDELEIFIRSLHNNCSNLLAQTFYSKEFQGEEHFDRGNHDLEFQEIAFQAVEEYYMQKEILPRILEGVMHRNEEGKDEPIVIKSQRKHITNQILQFLKGHTGFAPSGVTYVAPIMMNIARRRQCESKFMRLKEKFNNVKSCFSPALFRWLAVRYLQVNPTKLNSLAQKIEFTTIIKQIDTPFSVNDEKFTESLNLTAVIAMDDAERRDNLEKAIQKELAHFVEGFGHHPRGLDDSEYGTRVGPTGVFQVAYVSTDPNFAKLKTVWHNDCCCRCLTIILGFYLFCFLLGGTAQEYNKVKK